MKQSFFKTVLLSAVAITSISPALAAGFNISGGDLKTALDAYAKQSGVALMYSVDAVKGIQTKGVTGDVSSDTALTRILSGTGLSAREESGAMVIIPRRSSANDVQPLQLAQATPGGRIEEVLVTARRREEAVENIPISITAFSAEDLKTFGVRNFADLEGVVPGLNLGGGGNGVKKDGNPFIRGIGQRETKVTLDPAVGTYIDGIYIGRAAGALMDVVDVESIQVLRGPQGTLFGRNATGGAISVALKKPNNNWEANITANIGNYGRRDLSGTVNIPFVEDLVMGRFTLASTNSNGYFTNIVDNTKWGGDNRVTGIAQLRFVPTERITIDILGERTRIRETPRPQRCAYVQVPGFAWSSIYVNMLDSFNSASGIPTIEDACRASGDLPMDQFGSDMAIGDDILPKARYWVDTSTVGITANWDIGDIGMFSDVAAKSISAWRKTEQIADEDLDGLPMPVIMRVQPHADEVTQWSQEIQFSGKTFNDRLFLSTGLYFFAEETPNNVLFLSAGMASQLLVFPVGDIWSPSGCAVAGTVPPCSYYYSVGFEPAREKLETDNKAYAWYGQADFDITPEIQITGGLRWTEEKRWSRYSKGGIVPGTYTSGVTYSVAANQAVGSTFANHAEPGFKSIYDWQFKPYSGDALNYVDTAWTPMASLKYKFSQRGLDALYLDQAMAYATYSMGYHSGGVTAGAGDRNGNGTADPQIFRPEKVTNYEVGLKLTGLDRRVQANLAAFYMDYTDMQTTAVMLRSGVPVPYIDNVGASVIQGIEAEFVVLPTSNWRIVMNGSYTDADIKEWQARQQSLDRLGVPTGSITYLDRSDERMPRVPRWQFFASTDYSFGLGDGGSISPSVGVRFVSSIYHGFDRGSWVYTNGRGTYYYNNDGLTPNPYAGPYPNWYGDAFVPGDPPITAAPGAKWATTSRPTAFLDARLTWISGDGKMEAALWGRNLNNRTDYLVGGIPLADVTGAVGQVYANPRTFGLTFTYHFVD